MEHEIILRSPTVKRLEAKIEMQSKQIELLANYLCLILDRDFRHGGRLAEELTEIEQEHGQKVKST